MPSTESTSADVGSDTATQTANLLDAFDTAQRPSGRAPRRYRVVSPFLEPAHDPEHGTENDTEVEAK